jgi:RNA polymerase sigma factor (sigma-70 family)
LIDVSLSPFEFLFLEVFREQRGRIWGFFTRGATEDMAEELLEETFLQVWDRRQALEAGIDAGDREGVRKGLWRVAGNLMVDEIRLRQRRRRTIRMDPADPGSRTEEEMEWQEGLQIVRDTVGRVKSLRRRRCLELWLEGLSPERIAERLRLGSGQVRGLIQRARAEVILKATNRFRYRQKTGGWESIEINDPTRSQDQLIDEVIRRARGCLPAEELVAYQDGTIGPRNRDTLEAHLPGCVSCRAALEFIASGGTREPENKSTLSQAVLDRIEATMAATIRVEPESPPRFIPGSIWMKIAAIIILVAILVIAGYLYGFH